MLLVVGLNTLRGLCGCRIKGALRRTEQNVIDSDCTLVFSYGPASRGTKRTIEFAAKHGRSCHVVDLKAVAAVRRWTVSSEGRLFFFR